jgi:hypothetical protein
MRILTGLTLAFLLSALQAQAQTQGVLIKAKDTRGGQTTVIEIRLGKNHFHTDLTAAGERLQAIFDGKKPLFVQLNTNRKIYVADPALFGLTAADFDVLRQLEEFQLALMGGPGPGPAGRGLSISPAGNVFVTGISEGKPFAAVVLKRTESAIPAYASTFEVSEIRRETLPPNLFEIPSDFEKEIPVPDLPIPPRR